MSPFYAHILLVDSRCLLGQKRRPIRRRQGAFWNKDPCVNPIKGL